MEKETAVAIANLIASFGYAGFVGGFAVLVKAYIHRDKLTSTFDVGICYFQIILTLLSGAFAAWITIAFMGNFIYLNAILISLMFAGSLVSLVNLTVLGSRITMQTASNHSTN